MNKGTLVVLSGFSGAGKGTIVKRLMEKYDEYILSISATTRKPREGEVHGVHYFFESKETFESMIQNNDLLEYAHYTGSGSYYGTPKEFAMKNLEDGKNVILEIEYQGAMQVKKQYPNALLVFITPPSIEELKRRLISRNTETAEQIQSRFETAKVEAPIMSSYEYILINDDLEEAVDDLHKIVKASRYSTERQNSFISMIQNDVKSLSL
ncbi:MAG: guanylate kinase [Eubacteriales bacterium]|nr:guanylate kinase [Eubacteriales bacterium]